MSCQAEIIGVKSIALYINKDVKLIRPNAAIENEINLIAHSVGSYIISDDVEQPKWERTLDYSGNYKISYLDKFTFLLHGIENNVPTILRELRNNRLGYIIEIITTGNNSLVFPTPVFLDDKNTKEINSHSWQVSLSYRVPTFEDYLKKLNTVLMIYSYVLTGTNSILGGSNSAVIG